MASSANGLKLVALANNYTAFGTSVDGGTNWTMHTVPNASWYALASSSDGSRLYASPVASGLVYTSTNSGATWFSNNVPNAFIYSLACSADGLKVFGGHTTGLSTSADGGQTWVSNNVFSSLWYSIACTPDARKGLAVVATQSNATVWTLSPPLPSLTISDAGTNASVSWPSAFTDYQLQSAVNVGSPSWLDVTNPVDQSNGNNIVTIPKTNSPQFFRLRSQ